MDNNNRDEDAYDAFPPDRMAGPIMEQEELHGWFQGDPIVTRFIVSANFIHQIRL